MNRPKMNKLDEKKPLQNAFKRIQHCNYVFKLYSISIILFLKNNLTNICCKISKIGMNLTMVYICNMKSSWKYNIKRWEEGGNYIAKRWEEGECTLHCWPMVAAMERYLSRKRKLYCSKKMKVKN